MFVKVLHTHQTKTTYMMVTSFRKVQSLSETLGKRIKYIVGCWMLIFHEFRAILHDKSVYGEDTEEFRPERFMTGNELNPDIPPTDAAFGYGRRICAGRDFAEASVWITIVSLLATFNFIGEEGCQKKDYPGPYTDGLSV
jgi:hypothetical protein